MDKTHSTTPTKYRLDQLVASSLSVADVGLPEAITLSKSGEACSAEHQVRSTDAPADSPTVFVRSEITTVDAQHQVPSSIENIPVELFQGIVWEVVEESLSLSVRAYYNDITQMRLVCRRWTSILEGMPKVWAKISPCVDERLLDRALSRSVHCPLVITGWLLSSPALDKLLLHIDRWKYLDISVHDHDVLYRLAVLSVPLLKELRLDLFFPTPQAIPFNPSAPRLQIVQICNGGIQWAASTPSNLHELILLDIKEGAPDVDTFLELLSHSSRLTRLRLRHTHLTRSPSPQTRVSLPHLESLELEYLGQGIVKQLVESIDVPTSTRCWFRIALDDYLDTSPYEQLEPIGLRLATLANVSRGARSTLTLTIDLSGWDFTVSYEGDADQHGTLTTDVEAVPRSTLNVFEYFACQLGRGEPNPLPPILHIINLGYGETGENDSKLLEMLSDHLPNTDEIQIENTSPRSMENALNALFPFSPSSRLFPRLSTLMIRDAVHDSKWADWLLKRQKQQYKRGGVDPLPLKTLKIEVRSLSAETVKGLRKLVPNVVLDGVEVE